MAQCWCGNEHPEQTEGFREAATAFGHLLLTQLRVPEMVAWLDRRLTR